MVLAQLGMALFPLRLGSSRMISGLRTANHGRKSLDWGGQVMDEFLEGWGNLCAWATQAGLWG